MFIDFDNLVDDPECPSVQRGVPLRRTDPRRAGTAGTSPAWRQKPSRYGDANSSDGVVLGEVRRCTVG